MPGFRMKRVMLVVPCAILHLGSGVARSPESDALRGLGVEGSVDLNSAYVWRGYVASDHPVWQPSALLSYNTGKFGRMGGSVWANLDMSDRNKRLKKSGLSAVDYALFYGIDLERVELEAGHAWFTYRRALRPRGSTRELYAATGFNNNLIKPVFTVAHDYDQLDNGWYLNGGLNKEVGITDQLTAGAESTVGWGDKEYMRYYFGSQGGSGLADWESALYAQFALSDHISVGARLAWMMLLDNDARSKSSYRAAGSWERNLFYGGINLSLVY